MGFGKGLAEFLASGGAVATLESVKSVISYLKGKPDDEASKSVLEKAEKAVASAPNGVESVSLSPEVKDELKREVCGILKEQASPVYAYYVILFSEYTLGDEAKELLERVFTNLGSGYEPWEDEDDAAYQEVVDNFMAEYVGIGIQLDSDCHIEDKYICLNFNDVDSHLCCEDDVRKLADALNHFLGERCITGYSFS